MSSRPSRAGARPVRSRDGARRAILDAAAHAFADEGFAGARIAAVAAEARVSLKTLYEEFPGKEELFEAVIEDRFEQHVVPVLDVGSDGTASPGDQALALVARVLAAMEADRGFFRLYARGSESVPERLRVEGRDPYARYIGAFEQQLAALLHPVGTPAVSAGELAAALVATTLTLARRAVAADPPLPITTATGPVRALFAPALGVAT